MFHKNKTEAERQKTFDDYMLNILKEKEVIKKNQKIIDQQEFSFDPTIDEDKVKGAFNSYVDSLVVKNYLVEQIYSRLNINKSMALNFVNKLNGNQVLILSKVVNDFIKDIKEKYVSINDYILKTSFDDFQTKYNVIQQQEKNNAIVRQNQVEQGQILQENVPAQQLEEEPEENGQEENKLVDFMRNIIFKLEGVRGFTTNDITKTLLGEYFEGDPTAFELSQLSKRELKDKFEEDFLTVLGASDDKSKSRFEIQKDLYDIFRTSGSIPQEVRSKSKNKKLMTNAQRKIMTGRGYGMKYPIQDEYIPIGKYKAHKEKLMGGKLQMRSNNNYQVHNLKTQNITKNIRDILLKLHKDETINYQDVDKLSTQEKDQLYNIGKRLHITQLFDIPSTLKNQEDKLKDEFQLLRGSLIAGNNNPDLLRKLKIVLLKMKNNKLVSLQEYNEVLNILLELEI